MSKQELELQVAEAAKALTALKRAGKVVKLRTQQLAVSLIWFTHEGYIEKVMSLSGEVVNALSPSESKAFKVWILKHLPLSDSEIGFQLANNAQKMKAKEARQVFKDKYENDYWLWVSENVKTEQKPVKWDERVLSAIKSALDPEKGAMSEADLINLIRDKAALHIEPAGFTYEAEEVEVEVTAPALQQAKVA